jgi:hypothetical protein
MSTAASFFQQLASLEPSFQPAEECGGSFKVDGQRARLTLEPDGWLVASAPVAGIAEELLRRQADILSLAKVTDGLSLRAEMPVGKKAIESFGIVRDALERGLATIAGMNGATAAEADGHEEAMRKLAEHFASGSREWSQEGASFLLQVETGLFSQKIVVEIDRGCVFLRTDLVRLREPEPVSLTALVHFLLALNSRLRLARALLLEDRVMLEVVLSAANFSPWLIDKAVGALAVGTRMAKRECAALLDAEVARIYCEFHEERR